MSSITDASASPFASTLDARLAGGARRVPSVAGEFTIEVNAADLLSVCQQLREDPEFGFEQLVDLCGVDYLDYGRTEWRTFESTAIGFSRAVDRRTHPVPPEDAHLVLEPQGRFAVVSHLLSIRHNRRLRVRTFCPDDDAPLVDSVTGIWASADWFEREAFDLFGILFRGHPDLRRLLTDYGFIGHPFRKDFPLIGNVEVRYDPDKRRVIYQPVSIEPRTLVPKVIREDHRYEAVLRQREVGARPDERSPSPLGREGAKPTGTEQKPRTPDTPGTGPGGR